MQTPLSSCPPQIISEEQNNQFDKNMFEVNIVSFGYKSGPAPSANMLFDMRFLDNPYWVEELRPLTGLDKAVRDYVTEQSLAKHFLQQLISMTSELLPAMVKRKAKSVTIAFGCTGGQHRSTSIAEYTAEELKRLFPHYTIKIFHRELGEHVRRSEFDCSSPVRQDKTT